MADQSREGSWKQSDDSCRQAQHSNKQRLFVMVSLRPDDLVASKQFGGSEGHRRSFTIPVRGVLRSSPEGDNRVENRVARLQGADPVLS